MILYIYLKLSISLICFIVLSCLIANILLLLWLPVCLFQLMMGILFSILLFIVALWVLYSIVLLLDLISVLQWTVCQVLHVPTTIHWQEIKRILRYLKATSSLGISLSQSIDLALTYYTNADWANCLDDRRSTSSYYVFLGGNLVS